MKTRRRFDKKGGACMNTGDYGASVYGQAGSQSAADGQGNMIKISAPQTGGKRSRRPRMGGSTLVDLGVPVVLLGVNHALSKKRRNKGKKYGRGTRRNRRR